jgi:hypothetical protein
LAVATVSATPKPKPNRLKIKKRRPKERLEGVRTLATTVAIAFAAS